MKILTKIVPILNAAAVLPLFLSTTSCNKHSTDVDKFIEKFNEYAQNFQNSTSKYDLNQIVASINMEWCGETQFSVKNQQPIDLKYEISQIDDQQIRVCTGIFTNEVSQELPVDYPLSINPTEVSFWETDARVLNLNWWIDSSTQDLNCTVNGTIELHDDVSDVTMTWENCKMSWNKDGYIKTGNSNVTVVENGVKTNTKWNVEVNYTGELK